MIWMILAKTHCRSSLQIWFEIILVFKYFWMIHITNPVCGWKYKYKFRYFFILHVCIKVSHEVEAYKFLHMMAEVIKRHFIFHQKNILYFIKCTILSRLEDTLASLLACHFMTSTQSLPTSFTGDTIYFKSITGTCSTICFSHHNFTNFTDTTSCDIICFSFFRFYFWPNQWDGRAIDFHRQIYFEN